jgi:hypothetical protein
MMKRSKTSIGAKIKDKGEEEEEMITHHLKKYNYKKNKVKVINNYKKAEKKIKKMIIGK